MNSEIKRWGNSAAVRLSSKVLAQANLEVSTPVSINVRSGKIVIEALVKKQKKTLKLPFSEAELLRDLTPESAHADELATPSPSEMGHS